MYVTAYIIYRDDYESKEPSTIHSAATELAKAEEIVERLRRAQKPGEDVLFGYHVDPNPIRVDMSPCGFG